MPEFKAFIETTHLHYSRIECETPEVAVNLALNEFLIEGSLDDVVEILVLDPKDELGFGMPILQLQGDQIKELKGSLKWVD
ncbi:MAG: hypothetical protein FJW84_00435 [Actinobacteria bacterium]|nr:hypothetical protein [Actinomycetota bacterium]